MYYLSQHFPPPTTVSTPLSLGKGLSYLVISMEGKQKETKRSMLVIASELELRSS